MPRKIVTTVPGLKQYARDEFLALPIEKKKAKIEATMESLGYLNIQHRKQLEGIGLEIEKIEKYISKLNDILVTGNYDEFMRE
jgi:hypothetical protein